MHADGPGKYFNDARRTDTAGDIDRQTLPRVLIDHRQTLQSLSVRTGIEDEIVCTQISRVRCRQPARAACSNPSPRPFLRNPSSHLDATVDKLGLEELARLRRENERLKMKRDSF